VLEEVGHLVIDLEWFLIVEQIEVEQVANHLTECNTNDYPGAGRRPDSQQSQNGSSPPGWA